MSSLNRREFLAGAGAVASSVAMGRGVGDFAGKLFYISKDPKKTAKDYVQDGLLVHFDGIENVGIGLPHDYSAVTWSSLTDSITPTQRGSISFGEDYASFSGSTTINTGIKWNFQECTVESMFSFENFSGNQCICACTNIGGFSIQYENGKKFFAARDNVINNYKFFYRNWPVNTFCRNVFVVGNGEMKSYTGTEVDESIPFSTIRPPINYTLSVGSDAAGSNQFLIGKIRFVRIYKRALSPSEIAANYAIDKERFGL